MNNAVSIAAVIFGLAGFVAGVLALRTLGRLRLSVALLSRGTSGRETILDVAEQHMAASAAVRHDVSQLQRDLISAQREADERLRAERAELAETVQQMQTALTMVLRRIALVRYDAFSELTGRLSFSLALLDDNGDGIALTSIASQTDTRLYAKSLSNGVGEHPLSPEEEQAVQAALTR